jgi:hypothetical protein
VVFPEDNLKKAPPEFSIHYKGSYYIYMQKYSDEAQLTLIIGLYESSSDISTPHLFCSLLLNSPLTEIDTGFPEILS